MFATLPYTLWLALTPIPARAVAGDYAGWAYIDGGGDLPLRFHCEVDDRGLTVTLDLIHQGDFGLATEHARFEGGVLRCARRSSAGTLWTIEARLDGDVLAGEALVGDETRLEFDLTRSAVPLPSPAPQIDASDYTGTYRAADGRSIVITAWFWNELRYVDTESGRVGTLFATSPHQFFAGPAEYVPSPIAAWYRFELDDTGSAVTLIQEIPNGARSRFARTDTTEEQVTFQNGDVTLEGTVILPPGDGPHAAIVAVGGSDWRTRNQVRREADIFASFGLATLIFDKRGRGDSTGDPICSFSDAAADMAAAVRLLRERPDIRRDGVGVYGRSRGGWFAPIAAANHPEIAFVVVFVAPAISPARQETTRRLSEFRAAGHGTDAIAEAEAYLHLLWACLDSDETWERYVVARDAIEAKGWGDLLGGLAAPDSDDARWNRLNMQYDPLPALQRVRCPILALYGEADANVTPEQNVDLLRDALRRAGNRDATVLVLPRADHGLRPVLADGSSPPLHRSIGYVPEVWRTVRAWLTERGLGP